jgi:hypothetical protein
MGKSKKPVTMCSKIERYLVQHKRMAVGDAENELNVRPDQLRRVIYDLRKLGYPITSTYVSNDAGEHYVIYSIPSKWSKKSLQK